MYKGAGREAGEGQREGGPRAGGWASLSATSPATALRMERGHDAPGQNFGDHLHEATVQTAQERISICSMPTDATADVGVLDRCFRA